MSGQIIDGREVAKRIDEEIRKDVADLLARNIRPALVALRVGNDPASEIYVRNKAKKAEELGFRGVQKHLPETISQADLLAEIDSLNEDQDVDGILLQLPLPSHLDSKALLDEIDPAKDVDGFHPVNVGRLHLGRPCLVPCTPAGVMRLIDSTGVSIAGKRAVVVGRSDIVGKPVSALLLQRHATVTIAHSRTADIAAVVREGDIVVAAVGKPFFVTADMIRPGAIVIDVGINRISGESGEKIVSHDPDKLNSLRTKGSVVVGDVDFKPAQEKASFITPVPFGVGPMTIAMLMKNTLQAARDRRS